MIGLETKENKLKHYGEEEFGNLSNTLSFNSFL